MRQSKALLVYLPVLGAILPSPCTVSSQAFSANAFQRRIRAEIKKTRSEHVTGNVYAARNNEA